MNKNTGIILILLGIILVIGSFVFFKNENAESLGKIDTSEIVGDKINNEIYNEYSYDKAFLSDYIKGTDIDKKSKVSFPILEEMDYNDVYTEFSKSLSKDEFNITAMVLKESNSLNDYTNKLIDIYKYQDSDKLNYASGAIKVNDFDGKYIKFEYTFNDNEKDTIIYNESFYIIFPLSNDEIVLLMYSVVNNRLSDDFLSKTIDNIKIEEGKAIYLNSKEEDNKLVGSLIQKKIDENEYYKVNYKIDSAKYREIEKEKNTINYTTFTSKTSDLLITIETRTTMEDNIVELLKEEYKSVDNSKGYNAENVIFGNKEYTRISLEYSDEGETKYQYVYIYKIEKRIAYVITMTSNSNEDVIDDFVDYEVIKN